MADVSMELSLSRGDFGGALLLQELPVQASLLDQLLVGTALGDHS